jgi:hypothetical protein
VFQDTEFTQLAYLDGRLYTTIEYSIKNKNMDKKYTFNKEYTDRLLLEENKLFHEEILKALEDVKAGRVYRYDSVEEMFKEFEV